MERGVACGSGTSFVHPEPSVARKRMMRVERSENRLEHVLYDEDVTPVLIARSIKDTNRVEIFAACSASSQKGKPTPATGSPQMVLTFDDERRNWELTSARCENC